MIKMTNIDSYNDKALIKSTREKVCTSLIESHVPQKEYALLVGYFQVHCWSKRIRKKSLDFVAINNLIW